MSDYSVAVVRNSYFSTLTAGIFGTAMVLVLSLVLGKVVVLKKGANGSGKQQKEQAIMLNFFSGDGFVEYSGE